MCLFERIQTCYILLVIPALFFIEIIYFCNIGCNFLIHNCKDIVFHTITIHQFCCMADALESWFAIFAVAVGIMNFFCSINRKSDQKVILLKKLTPCLIDQISVCLKCIIHVDTMLVILLFKFDHFFKKINSTKRRFSSLECVADCPFCTKHRLADHVFQGLF